MFFIVDLRANLQKLCEHMVLEGQIRKMISDYTNPIHYYLDLENEYLDINQLIGRSIKVNHLHNQCIGCELDKPIYRMGYCKSCFFTLPQANESVIRPELSTAHLGIAQRDLEWEQAFELQPHIVYLAISSGIKVGVTRELQIPTRWIDQGASSAIVFARTENRYEAGCIEVALAKHISDKTNYQRMLKNEIADVNLIEEKERLTQFVPKDQIQYVSPDSKIWEINYPVLNYPTKVKSITLAKEKSFQGKLIGVKGQYWIFEDDTVFNVRNHEGYYIAIEV